MKLLLFTLSACLMLPIGALATETMEDPPADPPTVDVPAEVPELPAEDPVPEPEPETPVEEPAADSEPVEVPEVTNTDIQEDPAEDLSGSSGDPGLTEDDVISILEEYQDQEVTTLYSVSELDDYAADPVADPEDQTMRDAVINIFGVYTPRTQTVTEYLSDGSEQTYTEVIPGVGGLDWEWISGVSLFGLVLFSFLKMVGVFLKNG